MLPRQLEPEAMDSADEARDYDSMDHSAVNQAFAADLFYSGAATTRSSTSAPGRH
jgi:hypothetical protein